MSWWGSGVQWVARRQHWWGGGGIQLFRWPVPAERCWNTDPLTPITPNDSRASPTTTHTHTHTRAPQPSPLLETSRPSTHKITHIYTLSPAVTPIFPIWCSFEILLSYIYISPHGWLASCTRPRSDENTHTLYFPALHTFPGRLVYSKLSVHYEGPVVIFGHIAFIKMTAFLMFLMTTPAKQDQLFCGAFEKKSGRVK